MHFDGSVSVVIPTYNRIRELKRALVSVYCQTHSPHEVIVVDDGSTDNSAEMIAQEFPDASYFLQPNQGVSSSRNVGIRQASGAWVAFLDSDDEWLPNKLAVQTGQLRDNPTMRICHTDEIWVRNGVRVNPMKKHTKFGGWIFQHCLSLCLISPSSVLIHRSLFDEIGLFDERLPACEDYDLWLRICSCLPVLYVDKPLLVKYGGHTDQLSRQFWGMDRFRIRALQRVLATGHLTHEDRNAALETLIRKASVYAKGARKRGKFEEAAEYENICVEYPLSP